MKQHRDSSALAARLSAAAVTPVPLPSAAEPQDNDRPADIGVQATAKPKRGGATKAPANKNAPAVSRPITLRPAPELLNRYVLEAAERTRQSGRVVSAQEVMIDILERGL
jgi:hypothetical protein